MMGSLRNRFICLTTLIAVLVIVVCKIEIIAVEPVSPLALKTIGVKECAACHSVPSPIYQQLGITTFVRLVEASEWLRKDKHAHAYELVRQDLSDEENQAADRKSNARSIEICKKLGWTIGDGKFEKQCLTCHAGLDHRTPPAQINLSMLQFGVQCEACHGAGADYSRLEHHQQVSWREKTPAEKAALGMFNLTSPSIRAQVCFSCHMGDLEQNRFVTHPMYAAGHPPLPPVDLEVFLETMPPHWRELSDKPSFEQGDSQSVGTFEKQKEYYEAHFGKGRGTEADFEAWRNSYHRTQRSMLGSLVANDIGIRLVYDAVEKTELWGDFAIYDCTGCHHELRKSNPRWRPLDRTPGRAYPAIWWTLEYEKLVPEANVSSETLAKKYFAAFDRVPFGDKSQLVSMRSAHIDELKARLAIRQNVEQTPMTEADVREWLTHLYNIRREMLGDYWTAKQTAWMFQVAIQELVSHQAIPSAPSLSILEELSKELELELRIEQRSSVLDHQEKTLAKANGFNAEACQKLFDRLMEIVEN